MITLQRQRGLVLHPPCLRQQMHLWMTGHPLFRRIIIIAPFLRSLNPLNFHFEALPEPFRSAERNPNPHRQRLHLHLDPRCHKGDLRRTVV